MPALLFLAVGLDRKSTLRWFRDNKRARCVLLGLVFESGQFSTKILIDFDQFELIQHLLFILSIDLFFQLFDFYVLLVQHLDLFCQFGILELLESEGVLQDGHLFLQFVHILRFLLILGLKS